MTGKRVVIKKNEGTYSGCSGVISKLMLKDKFSEVYAVKIDNDKEIVFDRRQFEE